MRQMKIVPPHGFPCYVGDVDKGSLFLDGNTLVLKSEYGMPSDCYIVGSGEMYRGEAKLVQPCVVEVEEPE